MCPNQIGDLPQTMTAIAISAPGGPEVLAPVRVPLPVQAPGQILIQTMAAGINRPDILQRKGLYPAPPGASTLPGLEISGRVVSAPQDSRFQPGDAVVALTNGGGYAEYAAVPAGQVLPLPAGYDFAQGAALPETLFTVEQTLIMRAGLQKGQSVLIHGGAGGIGAAALQRARLAGASPIICTVSSAQKADYARQMGATHALIYTEEDFLQRTRAITGERGVDIVLDMVGAPYLERNMQALAGGGTLIVLAMLGGARGDIDLGRLLTGNLTLFGSTLRPRTDAQKTRIADHLLAHVWPALEHQRYDKPHLRRFPLNAAAAAHAAMEDPAHFGKIVLETASGRQPNPD